MIKVKMSFVSAVLRIGFSLVIASQVNALPQAMRTNYTAKIAQGLKSISSSQTKTSMTFDLPGGPVQSYTIMQSDVLPVQLQQKYPEIQTYFGVGNDTRKNRIALTVYHDAIRISRLSGSHRDDFESNEDGRFMHVKPSKASTKFASKAFHDFHPQIEFQSQSQLRKSSSAAADCLGAPSPCYSMGDTLYVFRWAIALEGSTNQSVADGTVAGGLAWVVAMINRLNLIWMRDLSSKIVLPDNADKLIFTAPNNGYFPSPPVTGNELIVHVDATMDKILGKGNWEYGYIVANGIGGGLAGGTHGVGDPDYEIMIHEIGHQWGSPHNLTLEGPKEGWSIGGTIMGNRGATVLTLDSVLSGDAYSSISIAQGFVGLKTSASNSWRRGFKQISTGNRIPQVTVPSGGFFVPMKTPFVLTGSGSDADGNDLTYSWEHVDKCTVAFNPDSSFPADTGPLFVNVFPTPQGNTRYFPNIRALAKNSVDSVLEHLPFASRTLNMRLVVRDNNPNSGAVNWQNVQFQSDGTSGPFIVTALNLLGEIRTGGSLLPITWDVANTNNSLVNCRHVDILLSTDGGLNYNQTLASKVPNSGQYSVSLPNIPGNQNRIMVKASENIFFDINNAPFEIFDAARSGYQISTSSNRLNIGQKTSGTLDYSIFGLGANRGTLRFKISGVPVGLDFSFQQGGDSLIATDSIRSQILWRISGPLASGLYPITLSIDGVHSDTTLRFIIAKSGTISAAPGSAARITGGNTDSYLRLPELGIHQAKGFTMMAIVRRLGLQKDIAAIFSTVSDGKAFSLNMNPSGNMLVHWNGTHWWKLSGLTLQDTLWTRIALVVKPGVIQVWMEQQSFEISANEPLLNLDSAMWIGSHQGMGNRNFNGDIDEVTLWDRALSQAEIFHFQTNHPTGDEVGLRRYHQFNGDASDVVEGKSGKWNKSELYVMANYQALKQSHILPYPGELFDIQLHQTAIGWSFLLPHSRHEILSYKIADTQGRILFSSRQIIPGNSQNMEIAIPPVKNGYGLYFLTARYGKTKINQPFMQFR